MSSSTLTWRVVRGRHENNGPFSFHILIIALNFSCVPEEGAKDSGLVVNDTPAGSAMEGVEHSVEMKEVEGGEEAAAAGAKEEAGKKKGPSNMVSGWGKGAKVQ